MDKLRKRLYQVSEGLELIIALVAVVGVVIAAVNLFPELLVYWQNRTNGEAFLIFLDVSVIAVLFQIGFHTYGFPVLIFPVPALFLIFSIFLMQTQEWKISRLLFLC